MWLKSLVQAVPGARHAWRRARQLRRPRLLRHRPPVVTLAEAAADHGVECEPFEWIAPRTLTDFREAASPRTTHLDYEARPILLLRNVTLWPRYGVAATPTGAVIAETAFNRSRLERCIRDGELRKFPTVEFGEPVVNLDCGWRNYYHWWIDDVSRLAGLHQPPLTQLDTFHVLTTRSLTNDQRETLMALLPANATLREIASATRVRAPLYVHVPSPAASEAAAIPQKILQWLCSRVRAHFQLEAGAVSNEARLFISRERAAKRRIANESEVLAALQPFGYRKVVKEQLSQAEQVALMGSAAAVVSLHGAGLTNLIFAQRPCDVLEIFPGRPLEHYRWLCHTMGHAYSSLTANDGANKNDDVVVPADQVRAWATRVHGPHAEQGEDA